jgi:gamma-glutamylaminecyclotransferase
MRIFVYGSLLSGEDNHDELRGAPRLAVCRTEPSYTLVSLGPYPAMFDGGTTSVAGEVYEVDAGLLVALDRFEGVPGMFRRERVRLLGGETAEAYLLSDPSAEAYPLVAGGDWRRAKASGST